MFGRNFMCIVCVEFLCVLGVVLGISLLENCRFQGHFENSSYFGTCDQLLVMFSLISSIKKFNLEQCNG